MMPGLPEDFDPQALATVSLNEALEEALGGGGRRGHQDRGHRQPRPDPAGPGQGRQPARRGRPGRSGLKATLLGSVSLHVTQHAPCPVTVVRD